MCANMAYAKFSVRISENINATIPFSDQQKQQQQQKNCYVIF